MSSGFYPRTLKKDNKEEKEKLMYNLKRKYIEKGERGKLTYIKDWLLRDQTKESSAACENTGTTFLALMVWIVNSKCLFHL